LDSLEGFDLKPLVVDGGTDPNQVLQPKKSTQTSTQTYHAVTRNTQTSREKIAQTLNGINEEWVPTAQPDQQGQLDTVTTIKMPTHPSRDSLRFNILLGRTLTLDGTDPQKRYNFAKHSESPHDRKEWRVPFEYQELFGEVGFREGAKRVCYKIAYCFATSIPANDLDEWLQLIAEDLRAYAIVIVAMRSKEWNAQSCIHHIVNHEKYSFDVHLVIPVKMQGGKEQNHCHIFSRSDPCLRAILDEKGGEQPQ
jgi:hypothetical protein